MPERLYSLLLRLYPARFRQEYGEEAMQLVRERLRDEQGFGARLRLWLELLADLGFSAPREHRRRGTGMAPVQLRAAGTPLFEVLESEPIRPGRFVAGTILAVAAVGLFAFLLKHGGNARMPEANWISGRALRQGSGTSTPPAQMRQATPNSAPSQLPEQPPAPLISEAEKQRVIAGVIANLRRHYANGGAAQRVAEELRAHEQAGDYATIRHGVDLADVLTREMWAASGDQNLGVMYSLGSMRTGTDEPRRGERVNLYYSIDAHFGVVIPEG